MPPRALQAPPRHRAGEEGVVFFFSRPLAVVWEKMMGGGERPYGFVVQPEVDTATGVSNRNNRDVVATSDIAKAA